MIDHRDVEGIITGACAFFGCITPVVIVLAAIIVLIAAAWVK